jgi:hypothetical protein
LSVEASRPIEIDAREVESLMDKAAQGALDPAEQSRLVPLLKTLLWLENALQSTRISMAKLKRLLFGSKTEKRPRKSPDSDDADGGNPTDEGGRSDPPAAAPANSTAPSSTTTPVDTTSGDSDSPQPKGHGRRAAGDYPGAQTVCCAHPTQQAGDRCEGCQQGRLYHLPPLVRLRFAGQPIAEVTRYERERLRCSACGAVTAAPMPPDAGRETYDVTLKVNLAVAHYHLGLPFKRIESYQAMLGMPLPDATQWMLVEQIADSAYPIYERLQRIAANQALVYQDDTGARVLSLIKENRAEPPPSRTGMYTTVLRFEGPQAICLYFTGRRHAGENLDAILARRDPSLAPIQWMSDGLAANTPKQHVGQTIDINCLVHGRRQFVEIGDYFPGECAHVIDAIAEIYQHDKHCREEQLNPAQRLAYHQTHAKPIMDDLKVWLQQQLEDHLVEPNSRLGGAFDYLLKRWTALTRFLVETGAPLDNNIAERALKMIQRVRKNSLFYKNTHGAYVGDVLTSLIETCRLTGANPLDYLRALMENRSAVFAEPDAWLPWNYRARRDQHRDRNLLRDLPPVVGQRDRLGVTIPQQDLQLAR